MNLTQPIIVNNQLIPAASVRLNILLNVSIHENIIVATAALFSAKMVLLQHQQAHTIHIRPK